MRVALFVEGSQSPPSPRQADALNRIWGQHLVSLAGCGGFTEIFRISKQNIEQLDPECPRVSGNAEALDEVIARHVRDPGGFDAAVVAWDVLPPLKPEPLLTPPGCRWLETMWIMARLAASKSLPPAWRDVAAQRVQDYESRATPAARQSPRPLLVHEVRLLCMEPEFEGLLLFEKELRSVFGVKGKGTKGWPKDWKPTPQRKGKHILHAAIEAARTVKGSKPLPVHGTILNAAPNEWGEWLLRKLLDRDDSRAKLANHPIVRRMAEVV